MITLASVPAAIAEAAQSLLPPQDMGVTEWAETYRVLSSEDSAAPGKFRTDARPYQRGIMDACSTPRVRYVTVAGASQWGKTQILNNIIGHRIHLNPGPLMVVQPTIQAAEKWSKTRFSPMVRDCPELAARVGDGRSSSNTILEKQFPGGLLVAVGANAPAGLASQPIRDLLMDEIDRIGEAESAGQEGDFEELAEARTADFRGRELIFKCSTGTIEGRSRIQKSLKESDYRRWQFECPHCGHLQFCDFHQVEFKDRPGPVYGCAGGGCEITEQELRRAILAGQWVATRPHITHHAGFHVHGLMVRPMAVLAEKFLKAKRKGPTALQVWVNTQLGEWWNTRQGEQVQVEGLMRRARDAAYISGQVPDGVGLLVAAVDVQTSPQRLELLIVGFGSGMEAWVVRHVIIPGNLAQAEPWERLEGYLLQGYQDQRIRAVAVDIGGHFTRQVYAFAKRPKLKGLVHPVKGGTKPQQKLVHRSSGKARLWLMDTVAAKDQILSSMTIEKPGPGFIHLPQDADQAFVEQILSERPVTKSGRRAYEKHEADTRNEGLDLLVYCFCALEIYAPRDLDALVEARKPAPVPAPEPKPEAPPVRPPRIPRGGGFGAPPGGAW